ncbi:hypothetical protein ACWEN3_45010, partial [Streptomyces sp. NPDC004561]
RNRHQHLTAGLGAALLLCALVRAAPTTRPCSPATRRTGVLRASSRCRPRPAARGGARRRGLAGSALLVEAAFQGRLTALVA